MGHQHEDCENDADFAAFSSGKNSRRKSSIIKSQMQADFDDDYDVGKNVFESHSKKASSTLRCLQDNETGVSSNAPRKPTAFRR